MTTVTISELRARFAELLDEVAKGKKFLVTRRGKAVAMLVPPPKEREVVDGGEILRQMKELRDKQGPTLGDDLTIRDLIEEGRRY